MNNSSASTNRALVVEDEPAISQVCQRVLTGEGFAVEIALNGVEAEDKLRVRQDYDLVLVDIRTPLMNGKELYHHITEKHPQLAERVIFTTGDVMGGDTYSFLEQSGRAFLPKPFAPQQLRAIVKETLKKLRK